MGEYHEDTIIELVNQSGEAVMVGDSVRAESVLNQARQLDPVTFELELAKRAWANQTGGEAEVTRRRDAVIARLGSVAVAAPDGRPVSSVLSFRFRDEILPYYAGDDVAARDLAANDFKYWALMRWACDQGLKTFDYGRSKVGTGPYAFKKNWGFEPQPLHYEYRLYKRDAVPQNNPANAKYKLMIETWRRLPLPVANWLGPFVVRSLG